MAPLLTLKNLLFLDCLMAKEWVMILRLIVALAVAFAIYSFWMDFRADSGYDEEQMFAIGASVFAFVIVYFLMAKLKGD